MDIKISNLSKRFRSAEVLRGINLQFESGKIYGIVGTNGSGKTMLLRAIAGLIFPSEGTIVVDDKVLHKQIDFPPEMGILIEKPEFLKNLTGFENLKLLAEVKKIVSDAKIKEYMIQFGLNPNDKKTVRKYSLGMRQKLGIIQAIMENQQLLILDEPFNGLDEGAVEMLRNMLRQYKKEGRLIIITSHHKEDIEALCDDTYKIVDGSIK